MGTTAEILLIIMIILLGSTLTIIGVQIFLAIREFRENIRKLNDILEDVEVVTDSVVTGATQATELMENLKGTLNLLNIGRSVWQLLRGVEEEEVENV